MIVSVEFSIELRIHFRYTRRLILAIRVDLGPAPILNDRNTVGVFSTEAFCIQYYVPEQLTIDCSRGVVGLLHSL